jgi:lipid-binding SYLF domain-containing protein
VTTPKLSAFVPQVVPNVPFGACGGLRFAVIPVPSGDFGIGMKLAAQVTMKRIMRLFNVMSFSILLMVAARPVLAVDKTELDGRIYTLTAKFEELQQQPDKYIPADVLRQAWGIMLLDRTRAGFLFAYQGGDGVALAKDPATGRWSPAAFLTAKEASLGFQIGAEQNFFVILLMSTNTPRFMTDPNLEFGSEARGTAGDASGGAEKIISNSERPILIYSDRKGLYGGAALKSDTIAPDESANQVYYGQFVTMKDILFDKKVQPTAAATNLAARITAYSNPPKAMSAWRK